MIKKTLSFCRNLLARRRVERALDDELAASLDLLVEAHLRAGRSLTEARRLARVDLGGVEQVKEAVRAARSGAFIDSLLQDVRLGLRMMRRAPGFTAAAVLTLAVATSLNTTVFTGLDTAVLRPLPFPASDRLVVLGNLYPKLNSEDRGQNSVPDYLDRRRLTDVFESLAITVSETRNIGGDTAPQSVAVCRVTPTLFDVLSIRPAQGRPFTGAESEPGHERVAILSDGLWRRAFGGSPSALGATIRVDGIAHQIVGVMAPGFSLLYRRPDVLLPLVPTDAQRSDNARHGNLADMIGRLRPGVEVGQAQAQIDALNAQNLYRFPDLRSFVERSGFRTFVRPLRGESVRYVRPVLVMLQAAVLLVLIIGCANVAGLLLIRATGRQRELAVRAALGAGRGRIARQLMTEGLCLAVFGTALGLPLAAFALGGINAIQVGQSSLPWTLAIDGRILLFAAGLAVFSAVVFSTLPSLQIAGRQLEGVLGRTRRGSTDDRRTGFARGALVVTEVALAMVLAVGAGLLGLSYLRANAVDPGFRTSGVTTARLSLGQTAYPDEKAVQAFSQRLVSVLRTVPGIRHAGVTTVLPLSGDDNLSTVRVDGAATDASGSLPLPHNSWIGGDYFEALGIGLVAGRFFDDRDVSSSMPVAIVDRIFAERNWPGRSAVGQRLRRGSGRRSDWLTVVGVVEPIKYLQLTEPPGHGSVYFPQSQPAEAQLLRLRRAVNIIVSGEIATSAPAHAIQAAVLTIDPELPIFDALTMRDRLAGSLLLRRLPAMLAVLSSGVGLLLAALGVYAASSFGVSQRVREIGIRLALGARPGTVVRGIVQRGMLLVSAGLGVGLAGALGMGRLLSSQLYGVGPAHMGVVGVSVAIVVGTGLLGCVIPARRASRVDVVATLRHE